MPIPSVLNEEKDQILSLSFLRSHLDLDELKSYGLLRPGWINEWSFTFCDLSLVCVLLCPHSLKWVCVTSTSFSIRDAPLFLLSLKTITLVLISFDFLGFGILSLTNNIFQNENEQYCSQFTLYFGGFSGLACLKFTPAWVCGRRKRPDWVLASCWRRNREYLENISSS